MISYHSTLEEAMKAAFDEAVSNATFSHDPSTKVGAMVADFYETMGSGWACALLGQGWNHLVKGSPKEFWQDKALKYPHVVHAEVAALVRAGTTRRATLVCSEHPCQSCAILAVEFGISRIVCREEPWRDAPEIRESVEGAKAVFARAGVEVVYIE